VPVGSGYTSRPIRQSIRASPDSWPRLTNWDVICRSPRKSARRSRIDSSGSSISCGITAGKRDGRSHGPPDVSHILSADHGADLIEARLSAVGPYTASAPIIEPLFGLHRSTPTPGCSAVTPHMLATPGVDTLVFDTTNAATYPDVI